MGFRPHGTAVAAASPQTQQPAGGQGQPDARVAAAGHADTLGNSTYNQALSQKRAEAVRDELMKDGLNPASIAVVVGRPVSA
jgi:outer membrane protein OmpA-like peptidoglycan-associated protein